MLIGRNTSNRSLTHPSKLLVHGITVAFNINSNIISKLKSRAVVYMTIRKPKLPEYGPRSWGVFTKSGGLSAQATDHYPMLFVHSRTVHHQSDGPSLLVTPLGSLGFRRQYINSCT